MSRLRKFLIMTMLVIGLSGQGVLVIVLSQGLHAERQQVASLVEANDLLRMENNKLFTQLGTQLLQNRQQQLDIENLRSSLNDREMQIDSLRSQVPMPSTLEWIRTFLDADTTNERAYSEHAYTCVSYAADTCANAKKQGHKCGVVILNTSTYGHAIIVFPTPAGKLLYYEPQADYPVDLDGRWFITYRPDGVELYRDGPIEEMRIIW